MLCSGESLAADVIGRAPASIPGVIAVDVDGLHDLLPSFRTTRMLDGTVFHQATDLSFKRNLGCWSRAPPAGSGWCSSTTTSRSATTPAC